MDMKKRDIYLLSIIIVLVLLSFYYDKLIIQEISLIRNLFLNDFFLGITFVSSEIIILFFLTSLFLPRKKRKWILPLWLTLGLSVVVSYLLKIIVHRPRPFQQGIVSILPILQNANYLTWNFSFPSFQAMLAFCSIPILSKEFPRFKYVWITFAFLIAFSRVYFGVHFMSDVLVGGLIGYLIGLTILSIQEKNKFFERIYGKIIGK